MGGFLGGIFAAALVTGTAICSAQPPGKVARLGVMGTAPSPAFEAFKRGLRANGWEDGKNIVIEWRYAGDQPERHAEQAAEFVRLKVDAIFAPLSLQVEVARKATSTIPIVFCCHTDPVRYGHVASLTRPGGNVTGVANFTMDVTTKRLEALKMVMPNAKHIGVLRNPKYLEHEPGVEALQQRAGPLGLRLTVIDAPRLEDFDAAYAALSRARVDAAMVLFTPAVFVNRHRLAELELRYRVPTIYTSSEHPRVGALMSFGPNLEHIMTRSAAFLDRILKGAKPADLPVEQATKYDLIINLKTAKVLGVSVPKTALIAATELID